MTVSPHQHADPAFDAHVAAIESALAGVPDRTALIRALREARAARRGREGALWWKWTSDAAASLGHRAKVIEASIDAMSTVVRRGARVLIRGDRGGWYHVVGASWRGLVVADPTTGRTQQWTARRLANELGYTETTDVVRFVVFESPSMGASHLDTKRPFRRLAAVLLAERGDLWIVFVFAMVAGVLSIATPIAVEALVNTVAFGRFLQPVVILALILFAFLAFGGAMRALQTYVVEIVQRRLFVRTVNDLVHRLPRARHRQFDGQYGPEMANRFLDIVIVQKVMAQLLIDGIAILMATIVGMAVLAFYHPWLLGFDVALLCLIAVTVFVLGRGAVASSVRESKNKYRMTSWLQDVVRCRVAFALGGAAEFAADRADHLASDYLTARRKHFRILLRQIIFALSLQAVAGTVLLGLGGWLVIQGELTLGQLVAAELIVAIIVGSFAKLGKHMESFYDLLASIDKLGVLFDLEVEDQAGLLGVPGEGPAAVVCHALDFSHGETDPALERFELEVPPGYNVAVYGAAGTGKTTLAEILFALRQPDGGYVEIDGVDPRDIRPDVLRRHIALAGPVELFHGTIEENVGLDRPHVGAVELRSALRVIGLLDELLALPDGLQTTVLPSGAPLTKTQQRRLMLARAIAGAPRLLIVDGLLDAIGDDDIDDVCAAVLGDGESRSTIVLTAREDVARRCDAVVRLERPERTFTDRPEPEALQVNR